MDTTALRPEEQPSVKPLPQLPERTRSVPAPAIARQGSPWYKEKLGDALVIGGVAASVVSLIEYRLALSDLHAAQDKRHAPDLDHYNELVDSGHSKRATSVVFFVGGGALITAGITRYVLHDGTIDLPTVGAAPAHGGGVVTPKEVFDAHRDMPGVRRCNEWGLSPPYRIQL